MPRISPAELGRAAYWDRDFPRAIEQLSIAVKAEPANADVRLLLARALIEAGRVPDALAHLEAAAGPGSSAEARFQAGRILQQLAADRYAELRRIAPESPEADELAGRQLELQGRLADALKQYRSAAKKDPHRSGVHFLIGNLLWRQRDLPAAETELRIELQTNPYHVMANMRMGELLLTADRAVEALPFLERAVAAIPDSPLARRELGKAYRKSGKPDAALAQWLEVAKTNPADDQVHFLLGTLYKEMGRDADAVAELRLHREILARRRQ